MRRDSLNPFEYVAGASSVATYRALSPSLSLSSTPIHLSIAVCFTRCRFGSTFSCCLSARCLWFCFSDWATELSISESGSRLQDAPPIAPSPRSPPLVVYVFTCSVNAVMDPLDPLGTGDWQRSAKRRVKIVSAMICTLPCCAFHFSPEQKKTAAENGAEYD